MDEFDRVCGWCGRDWDERHEAAAMHPSDSWKRTCPVSRKRVDGSPRTERGDADEALPGVRARSEEAGSEEGIEAEVR